MRAKVQPLFYEEQRFSQSRVRLLVAIPPFILLLLVIWQVVLGHVVGNHPLSNASLIGWTIFLWLIYFLLIRVRLVTELRPNELLISMRGLWRKRRIQVSDIQSVEVVIIDPVRDYGGYGIRHARHGTAYLAGGNNGVRLQLRKGGPVAIGSKRSQELADALTRLNRVR